jgi:hypothetical protein
MLDKGFSKKEILNICDKDSSSSNDENKTISKWITPSKEICIKHKGKVNKKTGECSANWSRAYDICSEMNALIPTLSELNKIHANCKDVGISNYSGCIKKEGFYNGHYWSNDGLFYEKKILELYSISGKTPTKNTSYRAKIKCVKSKEFEFKYFLERLR